MNFLTMASGWIKARFAERTTWDGGVLVAVCGGYLLMGGMIDLIAWVGLGYGIWTLVKEELPSL